MKVGLYWEEGYFQVVLTPDNELEQRVGDLLMSKEVIEVKRGGFYHCMGGWLRQSRDPEKDSVMLILREKKEDT